MQKTQVNFDALSDVAFIREADLVRSTRRPGQAAPLPFSGPTLWRMVKAGSFPRPCKLSARVTAWRVGDVRQWLALQRSGTNQ
jgi:prophage regulatory protein